MRQDWIKYIRNRAARMGLDPRAVLSVAAVEGLSGRAGDNNTSFGPFQLHIGGAMPRKYWNDPRAARRFAESPAGIDYALKQIAGVARGQRGNRAIESIVRKFERPADPTGEVRRALEMYKGRFSGTPSTPNGTGAPSALGARPGPASSSMGTNLEFGGNRARAYADWFMQASEAALRGEPMSLSVLSSRLAQLDSGLDGGSSDFAAADPGVRVQPGNPKSTKGLVPQNVPKNKLGLMLQMISQAQRMGLRVGENPYTDRVDPVHTTGSHHYQNLGKYRGKPVGRAIDVSGDPAKMRAFFKWASRYSGRGLNDLFHDPMGFSYDNGRRWNKTIGGHGKHVHLSV